MGSDDLFPCSERGDEVGVTHGCMGRWVHWRTITKVLLVAIADLGSNLRTAGTGQRGCYASHAIVLLLDEAREGDEGRDRAVRGRDRDGGTR